MKLKFTILLVIAAACIGNAYATETTYSARTNCEATQSGGKSGRSDGSVRATRNTDFMCYLPKIVWNQIRGAYVRVKPHANKISCRMIVYHPYGDDGSRPAYGTLQHSSGTSPQSLYVNVPWAHTYGQIAIQCFTNTNDKIYGFHVQNL